MTVFLLEEMGMKLTTSKLIKKQKSFANNKIKKKIKGEIYMSELLFLEYPKCTTCKKAKNWLDSNHISYEDRHIVDANPTVEELTKWFKISDLPLKRFFNTSGLKYKELGLKDKLSTMSEEEQIQLLATDGMLVKRPLMISRDFILIGFKEAQWEEKLQKKQV